MVMFRGSVSRKVAREGLKRRHLSKDMKEAKSERYVCQREE